MDEKAVLTHNQFRIRETTNTPNVAAVGDVRYADGTSWDPGSGEGYYYWNGDYWVPMALLMGGTYGWRDEKSDIVIRGAGANDPTWAVFQGNHYAYKLSTTVMNQFWTAVHLNHDYKPGSPIHMHVHWSTAGTNTGNIKWYFEYSAAKGHNQSAFPAAQTVSKVDAASGTAYKHMITETDAITSDEFEVDTLVLFRVYRDPTDVADTLTDAPFVFYCDAHYQTNQFATKNKAPNFYA